MGEMMIMEGLLPIALFTQVGNLLLFVLFISACLAGVSGMVNIMRPAALFGRQTSILLVLIVVVFFAGFTWISWFHYQIYALLPLEMPSQLVDMLNRRLEVMNSGAAYAFPLYDAGNPPRYALPLWIENEKYYFWFLCYAMLAVVAHFRLEQHRLRGVIHLLLAVQVAILYFVVSPFTEPLPRFFSEVGPWFGTEMHHGERFGLFMQLYSKMVFYYNAEYMWFHPPLLFLAYACITLTFVTSVFMLIKHDLAVEQVGYDFAKLGYFMLTLGMLLGYPWALKAWGPNWWWDPKICSSIMMWAVYSTYFHTRLYANKKSMWYFSSFLGILCFGAMIFTFLASFFFPGEHTF